MARPGAYSEKDDPVLIPDPVEVGRGSSRRSLPNLSEREELLCVLSHEFRTPLSAISGYLRMLMAESSQGSSSRHKSLIEAAVDQCTRLDRFMADWIDVSPSGSLETSLDLGRRSVVQVIDEASQLLGPVLEQKSIEFEVQIESRGEWASFDSTRILHVLTNLIGNAMAVTRPGGLIRVSSNRIETECGPRVEVSVIDQGPGVAVKDRERIFEPFVQGSVESHSAGRGIGLALCRRIVEAHAGEIRIFDNAHGGSRFAFTLPTSPSESHRDGLLSCDTYAKPWMLL